MQTRAAKRTPRAALKIAVDLTAEGIIDRAEALKRLSEIDLEATGVSRFATAQPAAARGIAASPGVASGRACFTSPEARRVAERGEPAILVRRDTSTEDVAGFAVASGILTAIGGRTSHAAVVARQMGKVCIVGCRALTLAEGGAARLGEAVLKEGDWIALDGGSGEILLGRCEIVTERSPELATVLQWKSEGK